MFQLFGRITWTLSLIGGYIISLFLFSLGGFKYIDGEDTFVIVVLGLIFSTIIKSVFFSQSFVEERIRFFANSLGISPKEWNEESLDEETAVTEWEEEDVVNLETLQSTAIEKEDVAEVPLDETSKTLRESLQTKTIHVEREPSPLMLAIKGFFSENILAKIGGILLFLGVLFFLNLIYILVGPVAKIVIGIGFGFAVYGVGMFLDKKGFQNESRILLGLGILINYLVILSGRYILGDIPGEYGILSAGVTFGLLILNTAFGVLTSLVYQSRALLIFSFVFAYLNPLLVGGTSDTPYIVLGYATIISCIGMVLMWSKKFSADSKTLLFIAFLGANILYLIAPFHDTTAWIIKIVCFSALSLGVIYSAYKKELTSSIGGLIVLIYVFFVAHIFVGSAELGQGMYTAITYFISVVPLIIIPSIVQWCDNNKILPASNSLALGFAPAAIGIIFMFVFGSTFVVWTTVIVSLLYFVKIIISANSGSQTLSYIIAGTLGVFLLASQWAFFVVQGGPLVENLNNIFEYVVLITISLIFLGVTYFYSTKDKLSHLYLIGTVGFIINITPFIVVKEVGSMMLISILTLFVFWGANILVPFFAKSFLTDRKSFHSFLIGLVIGLLYIVYYVYTYMSEYYPGVTVGFALLGIAVVYFLVTYLCMMSLDIDLKKTGEKELLSKNMILTYAFASLSILSLAVAFVFSAHQEVISIIWILEAMMLLYFFDALKEYRIYIVSMILFAIGLLNLVYFATAIHSGEYLTLISLGIILLSLMAGVKIIEKYNQDKVRVPHDILHIGAIFTLMGVMIQVLPRDIAGIDSVGITIFLIIIGGFYYISSSYMLKCFLIGLIGLFCIDHIAEVESLLRNSDRVTTILQYGVTVAIGTLGYTFANKALEGKPQMVLYVITTLYLFGISTIYVYEIFHTTFAVTIYWSVLAFVVLSFGIFQDRIRYRTIGLYILFLVLGKILLYDIWIGIDNAILRVGALMVVGVMMIIISMMYSKKYGNNLKGEFNLENLK